MARATHASLVLARFDELTANGGVRPGSQGDALFLNASADVRASGTPFQDQTAFKFAVLGLHLSLESAEACMRNHLSHAPWLSGAREIWGGALAPFRHFGEANFLDRSQPGSLYETLAPEPPAGTPIVVMTSVGWEVSEDFDYSRAKEFGEGVTSVRIAMSGVPGLHSQQTFSYPGGFETDGMTVTFWKDFASMRDFAYGPGVHRNMLARQREERLGDRTSFTRFHAVSSFGTWHGVDPLSW